MSTTTYTRTLPTPTVSTAMVPATTVPTASQKVFKITELLEMIIYKIRDQPDIMINKQRVSKNWKAVIKGSTIIQEFLFQKGIISPAVTKLYCSDMNYRKNFHLYRILPDMFSMILYNDAMYHLFNKTVASWDLKDLLPVDRRIRLFAENASWRTMHVAQPPIKKLHWLIKRTDERPETSQVNIPEVLAEFTFPEGLRIGDFFDLIIGTESYHTITWPAVRNQQARPQDNPTYQWYSSRDDFANECYAILVKQLFPENLEDLGVVDNLREPDNLPKYHKNIDKLAKLVTGGDDDDGNFITPEYLIQELDSQSAMKEFLRIAQAPTYYPDCGISDSETARMPPY
ncbi:hypothetical protein F4819DRAFT_491935 [Hypoxylon fuscum]|nr:hypothetical protein F4819DRAFT_491935 [Hypoxylon fuscum]